MSHGARSLEALAEPPPPSANWRQAVWVGYAVTVLGFGLLAIWALLARLDGAALASGVIAVESNRRTLQHLEGGIVRDILVRDGDQVQEGQVLIRLDQTRTDAQGDLYRNQMTMFLAQEARLMAESENRSTLAFPPEVMARASEPAIKPAIVDQVRQFENRRATLMRNQELAEAQVAQVRKEIEQNAVDLETWRSTLKNIDRELQPLRGLLQRGLVSLARVTTLEREQLRVAGLIGSGELQTTKLREKLNEAELRQKQVRQDYFSEASTQLLEVRRQLNEARQQIIVAADQQRRADVRAPIAGTVQQLRVFTIGGVVRPGDPILDLVPLSDTLVIRAKVSPLDVDRVSPGMRAELRFPAFRYFGSEVIRGEVKSISRDRLLENEGRDAFFAAEVAVDKNSIPAEIAGRLSAGMPADVIIPTGARTVMSYLLAPILERINTSMRER
jgi:HlyD family type I secretion membrane fusion protein